MHKTFLIYSIILFVIGFAYLLFPRFFKKRSSLMTMYRARKSGVPFDNSANVTVNRITGAITVVVGIILLFV